MSGKHVLIKPLSEEHHLTLSITTPYYRPYVRILYEYEDQCQMIFSKDCFYTNGQLSTAFANFRQKFDYQLIPINPTKLEIITAPVDNYIVIY